MDKEFIQFIANISSEAVKKTVGGQDTLVVPVVMAKEGVMNNRLYTASELDASKRLWNGAPVVVNHPVANGEYVSANSPEVNAKWRIGSVFNTKFDISLKGEMWINVDEAKKLGHGDVVDRLEGGEIMNVSTGLFSKAEATPGMHTNNKGYASVVRNMQPDHLAILPNVKGACSTDDGCGTFLANQNKGVNYVNVITNKLALDDIRKQLDKQIKDGWTRDVFDSFFVYSQNGKFFMRSYTVENDIVSIGNDHQEVVPKSSYMNTDGIQLNQLTKNKGGSNMDREKIVEGIIANAQGKFSDNGKAHLMSLNDSELEALTGNAGCSCNGGGVVANQSGTDTPAETGTNGVPNASGGSTATGTSNTAQGTGTSASSTPPSTSNPEPAPPNNVQAGIPATPALTTNQLKGLEIIGSQDFAGIMTNSLAEEKARKDDLVSHLVTNSQLSKEELEGMSVNMLEKMQASIRPMGNYAGAGGSHLRTNASIRPEPPVIIANKKDMKEDK